MSYESKIPTTEDEEEAGDRSCKRVQWWAFHGAGQLGLPSPGYWSGFIIRTFFYFYFYFLFPFLFLTICRLSKVM